MDYPWDYVKEVRTRYQLLLTKKKKGVQNKSKWSGAFHPLIPGTPWRHPKISCTTQSGKCKSRRNLRRFIAATYIAHQTVGRANPLGELFLHPLCWMQSHDNIHPIRKIKISNRGYITYYRTRQPPPCCVRTKNQSNIERWKSQRKIIPKLYWHKLKMHTR